MKETCFRCFGFGFELSINLNPHPNSIEPAALVVSKSDAESKTTAVASKHENNMPAWSCCMDQSNGNPKLEEPYRTKDFRCSDSNPHRIAAPTFRSFPPRALFIR